MADKGCPPNKAQRRPGSGKPPMGKGAKPGKKAAAAAKPKKMGYRPQGR